MASRSGSIASVLADEDIIGLAPGNPDIVDEYRIEAEAIAMELDGSEPPEKIALIVRRVFMRYFGVDVSNDDAERVARRIEGESGDSRW
jgi:hypothetical protein